LGRYLAEGEAGLRDRSSRPKLSPRKIKPEKALAIVELRRRRLTHARIAASLGVSKSTVGRVLKRAGLSRLSDLEPSAPVVRYEHEHPGDLVHIDTKKLGRIERMGKRIPGSSHNPIKAGWEYLFVAIDDHARIGFTDMYPDETKASAAQFLHNTVAYFRSLGVQPKRILTDNGACFRSKPSPRPAVRLSSSTASPVLTGRRPTARLSASSSRLYANGPTVSLTTTPPSAPPCSSAGSITTTGIARIRASRA
jgi:transposase InsO family protein